MVVPLIAAAAVAGIGLSIAGGITSYSGAKEKAEAEKAAQAASMRIAGLEGRIEGQKRQAMELDANRRILEQIRIAQRARSMSLTVATAQGAGGGSGLQGAYGQASGQAGTNLLSIFQNREIGRNIFGLNEQISGEKYNIAGANMRAADAGTTMALGSGLSSLGGSILNVAGIFAK